MRSRSVGARRARWPLGAALAGTLLVVVPLAAPAAAQAPEPTTPVPTDPSAAPDGGEAVDVDALRTQYEELAGAEADILVDYDLAGARLAELLPQVVAARDAVTRADAAVVAAQADLTTRREEEADADADAATARRRVRTAEERLREYAAEAYMDSGDTAALGAVFAVIDGEPGPLAERGYRRTVGDQQRVLIDELLAARGASRRALADARAAEAEAEDQAARVADLRTAAQDALAESTRLADEAAEERRNQEALIAQIRSRKVSIEARITSLQKAADGIADLLAAFQGDEEDWVAGAVDVRIPREGGVISSEFGPRFHPILAYTRLHAGADIGAPAGSPVLAAANGIVVSAEARGGYGNVVVVAHGHSLSTVYAHNTSFEVEVGQIVEQGDVIARAGSTGLSTSPHIHFETRIKGVPVNPRSIIVPEGDATWGKDDDDGDGIRNCRDVAPADPEAPVVDGAGDDDGDGQPNGGDVLRQPRQPPG